MIASELAKVALQNLMINKLRSFLSMLGIIIGVTAVIAIISIGQGATEMIQETISSLGSELITISPGYRGGWGGRAARTAGGIFTLELGEELKKKSPNVAQLVPSIQSGGLLKYGENNYQASIVATASGYENIFNHTIAEGRFLIAEDVDNYRKVVVLGSNVARELFGNQNPLGKKIIIQMGQGRFIFEVVGVLESKGQVMFFNFDDQVYIPVTTMMKRMTGSKYVNSYSAQATDSEEAIKQVEFLLAKKLEDPDLYNVTSQEEILETIQQVSSTMILMLAGIAGISLLVGGIGIMNIMLVSVTERTREIGIRKALGAKRKDILIQFLIEALVMSMVGGAVGLVLGWAVSVLVSRYGGWTPTLSMFSVVVGIGFSSAVGLVFGIYPAMKAAKLNPVEALRYE
ncbi:MAG: FtsX-like permease family protein [Clostridia bacterium]|nr:FtsX-like permease family protein [Clostridia bacterium]